MPVTFDSNMTGDQFNVDVTVEQDEHHFLLLSMTPDTDDLGSTFELILEDEVHVERFFDMVERARADWDNRAVEPDNIERAPKKKKEARP